MKMSGNQSYNRIISYLEKNLNLDEIERRYLIFYATQLYKNNVENIENETLNDIYSAIRDYNNNLMNSTDNSITIRRINEILNILQKISIKNVDDETLEEVSYIIDKLYCESDLPVRKNSSLSYNLQKIIERNR